VIDDGNNKKGNNKQQTTTKPKEGKDEGLLVAKA